jgi:hypothetical protein
MSELLVDLPKRAIKNQGKSCISYIGLIDLGLDTI